MEQLSLTTEWVDLTPEERAVRGTELASLLARITAFDLDEKVRREEVRHTREQMQARVGRLTEVVLHGREERPRTRTAR